MTIQSNGATGTTIHVLFVCLGNICRSPMAEAVFAQRVAEAGLQDRITVDSVGTSHWHIGEPPHGGTREVLRRHGVPISGQARQVTTADLTRADHVIAMDASNISELRRLDRSEALRGKLHLLLDLAPSGAPSDVPDPYHTGDFDGVYHLVDTGCRGLLARIRELHAL